MAEHRSPRPRAAAFALVALVGVAAHAPALNAGFVWDDHVLVEANPALGSLRHLSALFVTHAFGGAAEAIGPGRIVEYYRPVWTASLALDHALWGLRPWGYHLTSVLLDAATAIAVLALAQALLAAELPALIAALWFALHPAHVEAVAWVSARNEILAGLFMSLALLAGARAWRTYPEARAASTARRDLPVPRFGAEPGVFATIASAASLALGLLSKEMAITLPALAGVMVARSGAEAPRRWRWPLALAAVAATYAILRGLIVHAHPDPHPLAVRLLTAPRIVAEYLRMLVIPFPARVFVSIPVETRIADAGFLIPLAVVTAWLVAVGLAWRRDAALAIGLAWVPVSLLPVAGLVAFLQPALVAERYLYVPTIGGALAIGALARLSLRAPGGAKSREPRRARAAIVNLAALIVLGGFAVEAFAQCGRWRDDLTLMSRMTQDAPGEPMGYANLGAALERAGRIDEASSAYATAVRLLPEDAQAHSNLAIALGKLGRFPEAEREFEEALRRAPDDANSRYGFGWLRAREGAWAAAIPDLERATQMRPDVATWHTTLGTALLNLGRASDALAEIDRAIALDPRDAGAHEERALALAALGRREEAIAAMRRALELRPEWADARYDLGVLMAQAGSRADARHEFEAARSLAGADVAMRTRIDAAIASLDSLARR